MKIILFDIDHTLLNTTAMVHNLSNMISQKSALKIEKVEEYLDKYTDKLEHTTYFDFIELIETLPITTEVKHNIKTQYLNNSKIYTKHPDVDEVLCKLCKKGYELGIFSEGTPHFQKNKLKNLHINKFLIKI